MNNWVSAHDGLLDTVPIAEPGSRAWNYVTLTRPSRRRDVLGRLRIQPSSRRYNGTLNIEHEDALVNSVEGVGRAADLLQQIALVDPPDWTSAKV